MNNPHPKKGPSQGQAAPRDPRSRRPRTAVAGPGRQDLVGEASHAPAQPRDVRPDVAAARAPHAPPHSSASAARRAPSENVEPAVRRSRAASPHVSRALVAATSRPASAYSAYSAYSHSDSSSERPSARDLAVASRAPRAAAPARAPPAARALALAAEPAARAAAAPPARSMPTLDAPEAEYEPNNEDYPRDYEDLDDFKRQFLEYATRQSKPPQATRRPRTSPEEDTENKRQRASATEPVDDDLQPQRTPTSRQQTSYADQARKMPSPQPTASPPVSRTQSPPTRPNGKPKYPPLIVESLPNWASHFKTIKQKLGRAPNARPYGRGVKFTPQEDQEYRFIQRYLTSLEKTERISWFSYSLPADRNLKVAIRGIPADTNPEDIMEDLRGQGFDPEFVRPIRARKGRPGCIFLGILRRTPNTIPDIYRVKEILCMPGITIEAWRGKKGPSQCHRCQGWRHTSQNCHRKQACVRCGKEHSAHECPRPLAEPATCANCSGPHPANYVSCPVFRREARNRRAGTCATSTSKKERPAAPQGSNIRTPANEPRSRGAAARRRRPRGRRGKGTEQQPRAQPEKPKKTPPAKNSGGEHCDKDVVLVAIEVLHEVLQAVRDGKDPTQIVLRGLASIVSSSAD